jgi:hypothetical protein
MDPSRKEHEGIQDVSQNWNIEKNYNHNDSTEQSPVAIVELSGGWDTIREAAARAGAESALCLDGGVYGRVFYAAGELVHNNIRSGSARRREEGWRHGRSLLVVK